MTWRPPAIEPVAPKPARTPTPEPPVLKAPPTPPLHHPSVMPPRLPPMVDPSDSSSHAKKRKKKKKKKSRHHRSPVSVKSSSSGRSSRQEAAVKTFSFEGGKTVFDSKYSTLKSDCHLWNQKPEDAKPPSTTDAKNRHPKVSRVLTKGCIKEIFTGVSGGAGAGASTRTMLAVLEATNKRGKPGRRKKKSVEEWGENARVSKLKDVSPGSSCHSSKSPFSPRSSVGSDHGQEHDVKYGGMLDCSLGYKLKKKKKEKKSWKSKHKNVVDPVFLSEVDSLTQDMVSCQIEESQVSSNYWPERPQDSVPSIFRRRKILSSKSKKEFDEMIRPKAKRGRPKKAVVAAPPTQEAAEQRLPLKKRHRHHLPTKPGEDVAPMPIVPRRTSAAAKEGKASRKSSVDQADKPGARRPSAADKMMDKLNHKVDSNSAKSTGKVSSAKSQKARSSSSKTSIDSMAACIDKYTKQVPPVINKKVPSELHPPLLEKIDSVSDDAKNTTDSSEEPLEKLSVPDKARSPPRLSPTRLSPPRLSPQRDSPPHIVEDTPICQPKYSDISDDDQVASPPPKKYYPSVVPSAQSLTSASAEEAFDKLQKSTANKNEETNFADVEADIEPSVVKPSQEEKLTQNCTVLMDKLSDDHESVKAVSDSQKEDKSSENKLKNKRRKRKANRTGFPSVKKKKKTSECGEGKLQVMKGLKKRKKLSGKQAQPVRQSSRIQEVKDEPEKVVEEVPEEESQPPTPPPLTKRPRGRPPKRKVVPVESPVEVPAPEAPEPEAKRAKPLDENDDSIDCLSLLPVAGMESCPSSEAPSGAETDEKVAPVSAAGKKRKKVALFKKKSLLAGLFSDFYKSVEEPATSKLSKMSYNADDHAYGLLPPPYYCGRQLRQRQEDFQLPYDLWWLHVNKQLPGRDVVATWNYKRIKNNIYFDVRPYANFDAHACQCSVNSYDVFGCNEDCINRMTYTECDPRTCPCGDKCVNNSIQKHKFNHGLERFMTQEKGWGVKTKNKITAGQFIMEYVGEVVSETEFKFRMTNEYADDTHHYCLHLDGGIVIDGHRVGGECRFVNHSCQPNCEMQKWCVNGLYRMALFSLKDIDANEELTYDYNFSLFNPHEGQACRCGSSNCRGVIGGRSQRINAEPGERGRDRKKSISKKRAEQTVNNVASRMSLIAPPIKPLTAQHKEFIVQHRCFLFRNYEKIRRFRDNMQRKVNGELTPATATSTSAPAPREEPKSEEMIKTGLTALTTARSMQTRRLAIVQDDPNVTKVVKLAQLLREIYAQVTTVEGKEISRCERVVFIAIFYRIFFLQFQFNCWGNLNT